MNTVYITATEKPPCDPGEKCKDIKRYFVSRIDIPTLYNEINKFEEGVITAYIEDGKCDSPIYIPTNRILEYSYVDKLDRVQKVDCSDTYRKRYDIFKRELVDI